MHVCIQLTIVAACQAFLDRVMNHECELLFDISDVLLYAWMMPHLSVHSGKDPDQRASSVESEQERSLPQTTTIRASVWKREQRAGSWLTARLSAAPYRTRASVLAEQGAIKTRSAHLLSCGHVSIYSKPWLIDLLEQTSMCKMGSPTRLKYCEGSVGFHYIDN